MTRALVALILGVAMLAAPAAVQAQSAGDDQYVDPFQGGGGEEPAPQPEAPAPAPAPAPGGNGTVETAPGGNGTAEPAPSAEPAQADAPTLPRTGAPVVLFAAAGYALLLAGIAIRRTT
jgi:hypothetical protein